MKVIIYFFTLFVSFGCSHSPADNQEEMPAEKTSRKENVSRQEEAPFPVYMTFDEFAHHIHQLNDTTYIINFWATWCKPCVAELPYFEKIIRERKKEPVKVLLVSMDFPKQIKNKLIPFVAERKLEPHVVALADMDYNEWIDKVSTEWDGAIPFTLIYNSKKRAIKLGEMDNYMELNNLVESVLN